MTEAHSAGSCGAGQALAALGAVHVEGDRTDTGWGMLHRPAQAMHTQLQAQQQSEKRRQTRGQLTALIARGTALDRGGRQGVQSSPLSVCRETKALGTLHGSPRVMQKTSGSARRDAGMSGFPGPRLPLILRPCLAPAQPRPRAPSARCLLSNCLFFCPLPAPLSSGSHCCAVFTALPA